PLLRFKGWGKLAPPVKKTNAPHPPAAFPVQPAWALKPPATHKNKKTPQIQNKNKPKHFLK
ncbi:hypothetical protein ACTHSF_14290, partial [Neisseria sp. P0001.S010]|uniref:hypothetical protein n=1 Tax=Neisseria sp. P0001.S010 TaxID=3436654 RepID=UPI003F8175E6